MAKSSIHSDRRKQSAIKRRQRRIKKSNKKKVSAKDLFELLPRKLLEQVTEETGVDKQVKHLYGTLIVLLMVYCILKDKDGSTRQLAEMYNSVGFQIFSGKGGHKTAHNSIADRLKVIKPNFFEELYGQFLENIEQGYGKKLRREFGWLHRFDSTMVSLSAAVTKIGMRVGRKPEKGQGKVQVKLTLGLQGLLPKHVAIFSDQAHLSEETALYETIQQADVPNSDTIVFDMGLKGRRKFMNLSEKGLLFVTRLTNPRYHTLRIHKQVKGRKAGKLKLEQDLIVQLYESGNEEPLAKEFRLIIATFQWGEHAGKTFYLLTNILDLTANQITQIYLRRWDIEVFFRFIKQEVGFKSLLSYNENGIKAVMYMRLLTATMLKIYMWLNNRNDYKISKVAFELEIDWLIKLTIVQMSGGNIKDIDLKIADFQGIIPP